MTRIGIALTLALTVAGCGQVADSRLNPFNIFGGSRETPAVPTVVDGVELADPRGLIDQIATLDIAQTNAGAIIRATGVAARQGDWNGDLILLSSSDSTRLSYAFVANEAIVPTRVSTQRSREVTVAVELSNRELEGVRAVTVTAARNARTATR